MMQYRNVLGKCPWALNITRTFGPHGHLPIVKIPYICIEAALEIGYIIIIILYMGACPEHWTLWQDYNEMCITSISLLNTVTVMMIQVLFIEEPIYTGLTA